jgi:AcrR family transcriptional regulator
MAEQSARRRLAPEEREREIVRAAITYYAEHGFSGQTRELAKQAGISHALLFRYFPTKDDLLLRVYEEVFGHDWHLDFTALKDRTRPLEGRLIAFYRAYARLILDHDYTRLLLHAALAHVDFHERLFTRIGRDIYPAVIEELRASHGEPTLAERPAISAEIEALWGLHASIFFLGVREHIFGLTVPHNDDIIALKIRLFLGGAQAAKSEVGEY